MIGPGAPRDLSPDELSGLTNIEGQVTEPVTAPSYLFPGGSEVPPGEQPSTPSDTSSSAPGLSPGISITPIGPEGEPPVTPPPDVPPSFTPITPLPQPGTTPSEGISPGVSVTPIGDTGYPASGDVPLGGPKDELPGGGPILPPVEPLVPPATIPPVPDSPPWPIPQQSGLPQGGFFMGGISDPFFTEPAKSGPITDQDELSPDDNLRQMLITPDRVNALWNEIDETFNLIVNDVRGHYETTEQAIDDLKHARELLLAGTQYYDNAERLVIEVRARLRLEEKVRQWSRTRGSWLAVYLVVWLLLLSAGSLLTNQVTEITRVFIPDWLARTWLPGLFGGLGGVLGALWILIKHVSVKRDFDPIHSPWYVVNPFMGIGMGVVTYFVVMVGGTTLFNIAGANTAPDIFTTGSLASFLYLLCIVIGFNQNVLWSLIDRVIDTIFPRPIDEDTAATDVSPTVISAHPVTIEPSEPKSSPKG